MSMAELIRELSSRQVSLASGARDLRVRAPAGAVNGELLARLREEKLVLRDRLARVLSTPRELLERRVVRASKEIRSGKDSMGRALTSSGLEMARAALVDSEADLVLARMAPQNNSEVLTRQGAGPGTTTEPTQSTGSIYRGRSDMKVSKMFPSKFIKCDDLDGPTRAIIVKVKQDVVGRDNEVKGIVHLQGQKPLVLNVTNGNSITAIAGTDETDDWPGVEIELYPTTCDWPAPGTPCIRVQAPQATRMPQSAEQTGS